MKRIRRLLYREGASGAWTPLFAAAIIATVVAATAAQPGKLTEQGAAAPGLQAPRAEFSPYERWLNEEVVYIITGQELAAFKKLTTNLAREQFIRAFWERRNPNPGSAENEFKREYYRRIAYANRHFASVKPGWKTDRGHLYIIFGPPDEVETHLSGPPYPSEEWMYRHIDALGDHLTYKFVDRSGKGDFDLVSPPSWWKAPGNPSQS